MSRQVYLFPFDAHLWIIALIVHFDKTAYVPAPSEIFNQQVFGATKRPGMNIKGAQKGWKVVLYLQRQSDKPALQFGILI